MSSDDASVGRLLVGRVILFNVLYYFLLPGICGDGQLTEFGAVGVLGYGTPEHVTGTCGVVS